MPSGWRSQLQLPRVGELFCGFPATGLGYQSVIHREPRTSAQRTDSVRARRCAEEPPREAVVFREDRPGILPSLHSATITGRRPPQSTHLVGKPVHASGAARPEDRYRDERVFPLSWTRPTSGVNPPSGQNRPLRSALPDRAVDTAPEVGFESLRSGPAPGGADPEWTVPPGRHQHPNCSHRSRAAITPC